MKRLQPTLAHEWHVAVNRRVDESRKAGEEWDNISFMYEAKTMADEVPRKVMLFGLERTKALPQTHQRCSMQAPVPVADNHLACCLGVETRKCEHLAALDRIERCTPEEADTAKAWTCAAHIVRKGGDVMGEGYLTTVDDRMFWDNVHASLAQEGEA